MPKTFIIKSLTYKIHGYRNKFEKQEWFLLQRIIRQLFADIEMKKYKNLNSFSPE